MAASGVSEHLEVENAQSTRHYQIEKWYYDYAENIEAVNIHYACTPLGEVPDWNNQRSTRFLPLVETRLRRKALKLPIQVLDSSSGQLTDRYLLHYYFQIFADGDTLYSSLYTEEVCTGAGTVLATHESNSISERISQFSEEHTSIARMQISENPPAPRKKKARSKAMKEK